MNILQAIILGIIEGVTEFLPISSTGHLIIAQKLLNIPVDDFFTVTIQLGAILASVYFFRERIFKIIKEVVKIRLGNTKKLNINQLLGIWIILSMIPALFFGYFFKNQINELEKATSTGAIIIIAASTFIFGIIFYLIEIYHKNNTTQHISINEVKLKNILIMGVFQAISIIPGVSRSGITVSGGLTQNIKMKDSIEIAFLMGIPIIFAATFYKFISGFKDISGSSLLMTGIGFVVAFVVGLYTIKATLGILSKTGFYPFMIYRIGLAFLLLIFLFFGII